MSFSEGMWFLFILGLGPSLVGLVTHVPPTTPQYATSASGADEMHLRS